MVLEVSVKSINETIGENGLLPTKLVFALFSRYLITSTDLPTQKERMEPQKSAPSQLNSMVVDRRVRNAHNRFIPAAADRNCNRE